MPRVLPLPKTGGILPLLPIFAGLSALGTLADGSAAVAKTVLDAKANGKRLEETQKHNRKMEWNLAFLMLLLIALGKQGSGLPKTIQERIWIVSEKKLPLKLPRRALFDIDLMKYAKLLKIKHFRGVFMRDSLRSIHPPRRLECAIINLDSTEGPGTHWVAYKKHGDNVLYFDSFGALKPPIELIFTISLGRGSTLSIDFYNPIELNSQYEYALALIGFHTYNSIPNIEEGKNNKLYYWDLNNKKKEVSIPTGSYEISDIEAYLRKQIIPADVNETEYNDYFSLKPNNNTLKCELKSKYKISFTPTNSLGTLLGFSAVELKPKILHYSDLPVQIVKVVTVHIDCNITTGAFYNHKPSHTIFEFSPTVNPGYAINIEPKNPIFLPDTMLEELQIFQDPHFDDSIIREEIRTYHPFVKSFANNDEIEIVIYQQDALLLMHDAAILIEGTLDKTANSTGTVEFTNNCGAYLFDSISYELNGKEIDKVRDPGTGFNLPEFYPKEIAIMSAKHTAHYLLKPPFPYNTLTVELKKHVKYLEQSHHNLKYSDGYIDYNMLDTILQNDLLNADIVYVKGHQKEEFLKKSLLSLRRRR
ncbi:hypothetical protein NQ318_015227 [Aromia moschata]|uniref:Uncharacterized protein n=1 Tax=Aromia moschata TaxID=1265417 RepID=A0AAV8XLC4_9CUCU|nr:hypothetical protein NQ318_015227 [Aromia moschata]